MDDQHCRHEVLNARFDKAQLMQECSVPPRHIVSPGVMGISNPVASNETSQGRAQNRRVEVKAMVNKGIATAANEPLNCSLRI
jgi:hypothetical protein